MGAGAYLGTKAEAEVLHTEIKRTREEIVEEPYVVQENLLEALAKEGLSREAGYRIVKLLSWAPKVAHGDSGSKGVRDRARHGEGRDRGRTFHGGRFSDRSASALAALRFHRVAA
jgi:hypothetical protein